MSLQSIGNFFKKLGVNIKNAAVYLPTLEIKFSKAVKDAQSDSAETITTGKPFISAIALASANIAIAADQKGMNWVSDTAAVESVEAAFKLWPAFWAAIEKEGTDLNGDLK
jgi:hypothetical protein